MGRASSTMGEMRNTTVVEQHEDIDQRTWSTILSVHSKPRRLHTVSTFNHGDYIASNHMVTPERWTKSGLEGRKGGSGHDQSWYHASICLKCPNEIKNPCQDSLWPGGHSNLPHTSTGRYLKPTSSYWYNKMDINPLRTAWKCFSVQYSPIAEITLFFKRFPSFARLSFWYQCTTGYYMYHQV
jgi:hypothetical protein